MIFASFYGTEASQRGASHYHSSGGSKTPQGFSPSQHSHVTLHRARSHENELGKQISKRIDVIGPRGPWVGPCGKESLFIDLAWPRTK